LAPLSDMEKIDRHGLVMAIWMPAGLVAAALYHYGLGAGGSWAIGAAFGVVLLALAGHIVVNVVGGTSFTMRELATGLALTGVALVAFVGATLFSSNFVEHAFLPTSLGFVVLVAAFATYLILSEGLRSAFEAFDAIRSFSTPSRDGQRGGRSS
jgi:integral membrane sensor domain MASE1